MQLQLLVLTVYHIDLEYKAATASEASVMEDSVNKGRSADHTNVSGNAQPRPNLKVSLLRPKMTASFPSRMMTTMMMV